MNLVLDFGNTRIKAGLFDGRTLLEHRAYASVDLLYKDSGFLHSASRVMIGSVVHSDSEIMEVFQPTQQVKHFTSTTAIPIKNLYKTASTLGSDRLAAAIGAYGIYPGQNVLVLDAGTCLKFNFTNSSNEYLGGAISPGLQMRFKALQYFTDKLPLVHHNEQFDKLIGNSTEESILSGVLNGLIQEADGVINEYKKMFPDLTIVVSGGDAEFFAKRLKNRIFAHPHLILSGLNEILNYNS